MIRQKLKCLVESELNFLSRGMPFLYKIKWHNRKKCQKRFLPEKTGFGRKGAEP